jgi:predicted nucleic acid-binding protein
VSATGSLPELRASKASAAGLPLDRGDRIPVIAALADRHGLGILHHDHDYDLIAGTTDLRFNSVWLANDE